MSEHPDTIALRAWQQAFGTTQLSHAKAAFEEYKARAERAEIAQVEASRNGRDEAERLVAARKLVDKQAEDAGLWFKAQTAPEGYLQAALRELHAVIEGDGWFAPEGKEGV